ncbi:MAG: hypothetical protein OXE55_05725 [Flavobacteriaceae bacterium]|nr:hypothetical protein [Flavobacteriaceae bacterium]
MKRNLIKLFPIVLFVLIPIIGISQWIKPNLDDLPIKINYVTLRPAKWEEKVVVEEINERRNIGGLVLVYFTNTSDEPVRIRDWYVNLRSNGNLRLFGDVVWDRLHTKELQPGETTVQEICGISEDFQIGKKADFAFTGSHWQPIAYHPGIFEKEKLRVSSITMDSTLSNICLHIKSFVPSETTIKSVTFEGKRNAEVNFSAQKIEKNGHVIVQLKVEKPFSPGDLALVKIETEIDEKEEVIYSHRNAYADYFANGTWGIKENQYDDAQKHHLNTMVRGQSSKSTDKFFSEDYKSTGFKAMLHTGIYPEVDLIKDLEDHPAVDLWYLHDEPDWSYPPLLMHTSNEITKKYSVKKPTLITLCRNVKFPEFAFIPDIPSHNHYCVAAPTTSKWPYRYGTHLEETGYYTADLKYASEPKPIWVWTQGVNLWSKRPKMPLPTPDELGAQLYYNLGRGAKGNLWFVFDEEAGRGYPETKEALRNYSRVIKLLEKDLLLSDPWDGDIVAPAEVDVATLITPNKILVFVSNTDYQIKDDGYKWNNVQNIKVGITLPNWFNAVKGFEIDPYTGIKLANWKVREKSLEISLAELQMGSVFVFSKEKNDYQSFEQHFTTLLNSEK